MGIEDVVNGTAEETPQVVEAAPIEAPAAEVAETIVEAAPAEEPKPAAEAPAEEPKADRSVPLPTFLDMRDKLKAAEARAAQLESQQQPAKMPDPYDDPDGFRAHVEREVEARVTNQRFETSKLLAVSSHGQETVDGAIEWAMGRAQSDPVFAASYMREQHPIDWIVRQQKRDGLLSQIGETDLDTFVKNYVTQNGEKLGLTAPAATTVVADTQQAPAPPRSIASDRSTGGAVKDVPTGPLASTEAVFTR